MNKENQIDIKAYCERVLKGNSPKEETYISREGFEKDLPDKQMQEEFFKCLSEKLNDENKIRSVYGLILSISAKEMVPKLKEMFKNNIINNLTENTDYVYIISALGTLKVRDISLESDLLNILKFNSEPYWRWGSCLHYLIAIDWGKAFYFGMVDLISRIKRSNYKGHWMGEESLVERFIRAGKQVFIDKALEYFKETGDEKLISCFNQILKNVKKDLARENFQYN